MPSQPSISLKIVGAQQIIRPQDGVDALQQFYGGLYSRLSREVRHTGSLIRYIGYQSPAGEGAFRHFFGIQVDKIEDIPAGLAAWELDERSRAVWENRNGRDQIVSRDEIAWQWVCDSPAGDAHFTGEFTRHATDGDSPFWISTNAYAGLDVSEANPDEILLVDYDPSWPEQFDEMAQWLRVTLGRDIALRFEHFGSTAIPGMPAKPVIDILVEVPSFAEAKRRVVPRLNDPRWEYWWTSQHMLFIRRDRLMGQRTHHVHLATAGHVLWQGIPFRDTLRSHAQDARRYAELKRELAEKFRDNREAYTEAKTDFVKEILSKATPGG